MEALAQVVIGVDAHKRTHTLVAADELGRELATKTLAATADGHLAAIAWASRWPTRRWAIEDCRHLTRTLEADLLRAGEQVVRVPTQMMAGVRRSARQPGKSDAIDALAVARAAWREPDLPVAQLDGPSRQVRLLVDHRDDLVAERTRLQSRIRWHLHEIAPDLEIPARGLKLQHVVERVAARLASIDGLIAAISRELLDRVRELNRRINELEREITPLIPALAPTLLAIPGCGALTAAKLVGETAAPSGSAPRAPTRAGTAPHPSPPAPAPPTAFVSTAAATAKSTPPCTASPSPRRAPGPKDATTSPNASGTATPRPKRSPPAPPTLRRRLPHHAHRRARRPTRSGIHTHKT